MSHGSVGDGQFAPVISGAVLYEREHRYALGGKVGDHVGLGHDDLSVQDVVVGVIALVDDERKVDDESGGVALAVGAGVGVVGRNAVVSQKLGLAHPVDDDASAVAVRVAGEILPSADGVQRLILDAVGINSEIDVGQGLVGVLGIRVASLPQKRHEGCQNDDADSSHSAKKTFFF